jgi:glycine/sarcosine N-methyltransferase
MYDAFSTDYDRFVNWDSRLGYEMPFITQLLDSLKETSSGPPNVLDAACGTGMHVIDMVKRGYPSAGADLSAGMIAKARQNSAAAAIQAEFATAGFGSLAAAFSGSPLLPFDAVLCLGNSLPHLLNPLDLSVALADFNACLRPGGLLLLQNRNFDAVMRDRQRWMEPQSFREDQDEWLFLRFYDYLPGDLIDFNVVSLHRSAQPGSQPAGWQQSIHTTRLRPLLQSELETALAGAGFHSVTAYGSMQGDAFQPLSSGNLIITARA